MKNPNASAALLCLGLIACAMNRVTAQQSNQAAGPQDSSTGTLRIKTDVTEVQVLLDNKEAGRTPLTVRTVTAGTHRLILIKDGYQDHHESVEIGAQKTNSIFVVMKPLNVPMPELPVEFKVLHQHRMGHCTGVLTVTAETLDFKAEKDEDRFQIPIRSLQSVTRSWGPLAGLGPSGINAATDMMAFRVEAPGRSYGFMAYKETPEDKMDIASERTRALFETVYRLWTKTLKPKEK